MQQHALRARRVLVGARGQSRHQSAGRGRRLAALQDLSHLREDAVSRRSPSPARPASSAAMSPRISSRAATTVVPVAAARSTRRVAAPRRFAARTRSCISPAWCRRARAGITCAANVDGTRAVAEAARAAGVPLVHMSSLAAAGPASPRRRDPKRIRRAPINAYGRSKLEGEHAVAGGARSALDDAASGRGLRAGRSRPAAVVSPRETRDAPARRPHRRRLHLHAHRRSGARDRGRGRSAAAGDTMFVGHPDPVSTQALLEGVRAARGGRGTIVRIPLGLTRLAAYGGDAAGALFGTRTLINSRRYVELASEGFVCRVDRLRDRLGVVATDRIARRPRRRVCVVPGEGWL